MCKNSEKLKPLHIFESICFIYLKMINIYENSSLFRRCSLEQRFRVDRIKLVFKELNGKLNQLANCIKISLKK